MPTSANGRPEPEFRSHGEPLFLVGCPRSGTTLLQRMLDAHPHVAIAPETFFIRKVYMRRREYGDLGRESNWNRLIEDVMAMPVFDEMGLTKDKFISECREIERSYSSLFGLMLRQYKTIRRARLVGEKTPNHLLYIPTLSRFFPSAVFVHIIRDPRGVVNSWKEVPWSTGSVVGDAHVWKRYLLSVRRIRKPVLSSFMTVRYEDLVENPLSSMKRVCDFLKLPFDNAVIDFNRYSETSIDKHREPWKERSFEPLDKSRALTWRKELSRKELAEIEAVVGREMRRYDYQPIAERHLVYMAMGKASLFPVMRKVAKVLRGRF